MNRIKNAIEDIEKSLRSIDNATVVLKTLVLLMVSYLFLFLIGVEGHLAFIPAVIYFVSSIFVHVRLDRLRYVEKEFSSLDEKLRTARDYQDKDNLILSSLEEEVVTELKNVKLSRFFPYPRFLILVAVLILAVSSTLFIASQELRIIDFNSVIDAAIRNFANQENQTAEEVDFTGGEESIMQIGNEKIEVEINPVGIDFDFNDVSDIGDYSFSTSFPDEVFLSSGAAYEEEFSEEQQALIKGYFDRKSGGKK